ncbi:MAG: DNA-binding protein [Sphingobacteriales bacterium]|nr:MAG: DNA-binding protein [Sphingobacteriales bacterium]
MSSTTKQIASVKNDQPVIPIDYKEKYRKTLEQLVEAREQIRAHQQIDTRPTTTQHRAENGVAQSVQPARALSPELAEVVRREAWNYLSSFPYHTIQCVNVGKAAELLCVEEDTVRTYIKCGKLAASKVGKEYRIRIFDLQQFLDATAVVKVMRKRKHNIAS